MEVLINPRTRCWRNNIIDHVFNVQEAEVIKNIPLSLTTQPDILIWPFTPSGSYSVKSGYRFLLENSAQFQSTDHDAEYWKNVWSLEVPSKIKNFVWRASKDALPVKKNLLHRRISQDGQCEICKAGDEDCLHALFFCPEVQAMWIADPQWKWLTKMCGSTMKDIFKRVFSEKKDAELLAFTAWAIWNRRNQLRFNEVSCPLNQILSLSKDRKLEFQCIHPVTITPQHRNHTRWKPPEQGVYKVNYDGAMFNQQNRAGLDVVIRNIEGAIMASMSQQIPLPTTVAQVKALAARRAAAFALEVGINKAILEDDSETIVKELMESTPSLALHGHLLQDVKSLQNSFNFLSFTHVHRQGNNVAHTLARRAIKQPNLTVWMEDVPPDIRQLVMVDSATI